MTTVDLFVNEKALAGLVLFVLRIDPPDFLANMGVHVSEKAVETDAARAVLIHVLQQFLSALDLLHLVLVALFDVWCEA